MERKYKTDLDIARQHLANLFQEHERIEIEIAKQQRKVAALASLSDESEETDQVLDLGLGGLTNAIRTVFRAAEPRPLLAIEVRDRLRQLAFPVDEYQNILASIHTTLRRMHANNELDEVVIANSGGSGPVGYRWKRLTFGQKIGRDNRPNSAYESGMRGNEKPKK